MINCIESLWEFSVYRQLPTKNIIKPIVCFWMYFWIFSVTSCYSYNEQVLLFMSFTRFYLLQRASYWVDLLCQMLFSVKKSTDLSDMVKMTEIADDVLQLSTLKFVGILGKSIAKQMFDEGDISRSIAFLCVLHFHKSSFLYAIK